MFVGTNRTQGGNGSASAWSAATVIVCVCVCVCVRQMPRLVPVLAPGISLDVTVSDRLSLAD